MDSPRTNPAVQINGEHQEGDEYSAPPERAEENINSLSIGLPVDRAPEVPDTIDEELFFHWLSPAKSFCGCGSLSTAAYGVAFMAALSAVNNIHFCANPLRFPVFITQVLLAYYSVRGIRTLNTSAIDKSLRCCKFLVFFVAVRDFCSVLLAQPFKPNATVLTSPQKILLTWILFVDFIIRYSLIFVMAYFMWSIKVRLQRGEKAFVLLGREGLVLLNEVRQEEVLNTQESSHP